MHCMSGWRENSTGYQLKLSIFQQWKYRINFKSERHSSYYYICFCFSSFPVLYWGHTSHTKTMSTCPDNQPQCTFLLIKTLTYLDSILQNTLLVHHFKNGIVENETNLTCAIFMLIVTASIILLNRDKPNWELINVTLPVVSTASTRWGLLHLKVYGCGWQGNLKSKGGGRGCLTRNYVRRGGGGVVRNKNN